LVLFKVVKGVRSRVAEANNVPHLAGYNELRVSIRGTTMTSYLNGKLYITHKLSAPASGKVGVWSKDDSTVYVDDVVISGGSGGGSGRAQTQTPTKGGTQPGDPFDKGLIVGVAIVLAGIAVIAVALSQD
jgi:hypothetical protein